jgi:hypothetical protein
MLKTIDVFGIRTNVSEHSYIDRGKLDSEIQKLANQNQHIALRGESKSGKSWLRQRVFTNSNVVACRLDYTPVDIYRQILANLDISVTVERSNDYVGSLELQGTSGVGWKWLASASGTVTASGEISSKSIKRPIGKNEFDFEFLAKIIAASGRRVIIEDFHYLGSSVQETLAHELKSFWDFGIYFVVVGVWHRKNFVTFLNPDLAGRITEVEVSWTTEELAQSIIKGAVALNVMIDSKVTKRLADDSYSNIGILQSLALSYFEKMGISETQTVTRELNSLSGVDDAGMAYAEQIEAIYTLFAESVSDGIRKRKDATQIYAFAMWAIIEADDATLIRGMTVDEIFEIANKRQSRIQKPNLRSVLRKFKELQVDSRGNRLVLTFDDPTDSIIIVDRALLFYRKYATRKWPWEKMAIEAQEANSGLSPD